MSCHFIDMVCGWEDLAVLVVLSCIMVCQERERGQGEKLLQDEAVRVTMLPLVSLLFSCFTAHASPHPNTSAVMDQPTWEELLEAGWERRIPDVTKRLLLAACCCVTVAKHQGHTGKVLYTYSCLWLAGSTVRWRTSSWSRPVSESGTSTLTVCTAAMTLCVRRIMTA